MRCEKSNCASISRPRKSGGETWYEQYAGTVGRRRRNRLDAMTEAGVRRIVASVARVYDTAEIANFGHADVGSQD